MGNTQRIYPTAAPHGGSFTLTGNGNAADILTFNMICRPIVQNNTAATIYVAAGSGVGTAATQGDEAVVAGAEYEAEEVSTWVSIYGVASTHVNGTTTAGIVVYGLE